MLSTAAFWTLLDELEHYKNRSETLAIEIQCIHGLAEEAKELRQKLAERKKADTASKTTPKGQKDCSTAADKRACTLKTALVTAKAAHTCLVGVSAQVDEDAKGTRIELWVLQVRYLETVKKAKVANERLEEVWQQFVISVRVAEETSRQLTKFPARSGALKM